MASTPFQIVIRSRSIRPGRPASVAMSTRQARGSTWSGMLTLPHVPAGSAEDAVLGRHAQDLAAPALGDARWRSRPWERTVPEV
jgi:hypothetical protein